MVRYEKSFMNEGMIVELNVHVFMYQDTIQSKYSVTQEASRKLHCSLSADRHFQKLSKV